MALVQLFDIDGNITLGALGGNDAILGVTKIDASKRQGFRIVKSDWFLTLTGKTTAEGPIMIGVCCNMNAAEVEAAIEADPQGRTDDETRGKGTFIKLLMVLGLLDTAFPTPDGGRVFHREVKYGKNGWSIPEGKTLSLFAYNSGSALTSGTVVLFSAEHFGVYLRD